MRFTAISSAVLAISLAGCGSEEDGSSPPVVENATATIDVVNVADESVEADAEEDTDPADNAEANSEATDSAISVDGTPVEPTLNPSESADSAEPASSTDPDETLAAAQDAIDNARQAVELADAAADGQ